MVSRTLTTLMPPWTIGTQLCSSVRSSGEEGCWQPPWLCSALFIVHPLLDLQLLFEATTWASRALSALFFLNTTRRQFIGSHVLIREATRGSYCYQECPGLPSDHGKNILGPGVLPCAAGPPGPMPTHICPAPQAALFPHFLGLFSTRLAVSSGPHPH